MRCCESSPEQKNNKKGSGDVRNGTRKIIEWASIWKIQLIKKKNRSRDVLTNRRPASCKAERDSQTGGETCIRLQQEHSQGYFGLHRQRYHPGMKFRGSISVAQMWRRLVCYILSRYLFSRNVLPNPTELEEMLKHSGRADKEGAKQIQPVFVGSALGSQVCHPHS